MSIYEYLQYPPQIAYELAVVPRKICIERTGVDENSIKQFSDGPVPFDNDEKLKCYMSCMFNETGSADENGEPQLMKIFEKIPEKYLSIAFKMGKNCMKIIGNTKCERAFSLHKCWKEKDPKVKRSFRNF